MDLELARIYGTLSKTASAPSTPEDLEKQAQKELFSKLAANNGIDLNSLSDDQINQLWSETFGTKLAGEMPPQFAAHMKGKGEHEEKGGKEEGKAHEEHESKSEEKKEHEKKAAAEFAALQAQNQEQAKLAEADRAGRVMAHAMVQELNSINAELAKQAAAGGAAPAAAAPAAAPTAISKYASDKAAAPFEKKDEEKKEEKKDEKRKEASSIEFLAIDRAFEMAKAASLDLKDVSAKLSDSLADGITESSKLASARTLEEAVEIRALEFLEGAGFPVQWS